MNHKLELRRFATDVGVNFLRVTLMTLFGIGISIFLARGLGVEGKGFYELAIFLPTILQAVLNIGSHLATVYYVGTGKYDLGAAARGNLTLSFWMGSFGTAVGTIVILFASPQLFPGVPIHLLLLSLALLPFIYARPNLSGIFQAKQDFRAFTAIELIPFIINFLVLLLTIWWFPDRPAAAILALITGNIVALLYALRLLRRQVNQGLFKLRFDPQFIRDWLKYGLKAQLGLIMLFLLFRVDVYLINQIGGGAASVGIYSIAVVLAERIWVFSGFAAQVMISRIASWEGEEEKRTELTLITMRFTLWLSFLIAGGVILFGALLIGLLYGEAFLPAATALYLILPGIIMYNFSRVLGSDMSARGKPIVNSALFTLALFINITANLLLIPQWDYLGAAVASSIAYSILGLATLVVFCRMHRVFWVRAILPTYEDVERIQQGLQLIRLRLRRNSV